VPDSVGVSEHIPIGFCQETGEGGGRAITGPTLEKNDLNTRFHPTSWGPKSFEKEERPSATHTKEAIGEFVHWGEGPLGAGSTRSSGQPFLAGTGEKKNKTGNRRGGKKRPTSQHRGGSNLMKLKQECAVEAIPEGKKEGRFAGSPTQQKKNQSRNRSLTVHAAKRWANRGNGNAKKN